MDGKKRNMYECEGEGEGGIGKAGEATGGR
ncbi:uncharacterized protein G2W53_024691 [Senna tora]|uniref:Uncharacterized protein n=1 Tax=Senna tora TaxID=362788 RepID=A0A834TDH5_9FABA|nr:uncharacterized protein G2W53_024691 [Senna tora]